MHYVGQFDALAFVNAAPAESVDLVLTDPPYYGIVKDTWDNQWSTQLEFETWLYGILTACHRVLKPHGSLIFFGGLGKHGCHPFQRLCMSLESVFQYRNTLTWKKRRGFGKDHDYLFCREEIVWFSKSAKRTEVRFNIPYLPQLRGYAGWNKAYPAKDPRKRVSNVWDDFDATKELTLDQQAHTGWPETILSIPEIMRPERTAEKPIELMRRLVMVHTDPGDTILDPFCGLGATAEVCARINRSFWGCDTDPEAVSRTQEKLATPLEEENNWK